jgi:hypothetical protein
VALLSSLARLFLATERDRFVVLQVGLILSDVLYGFVIIAVALVELDCSGGSTLIPVGVGLVCGVGALFLCGEVELPAGLERGIPKSFLLRRSFGLWPGSFICGIPWRPNHRDSHSYNAWGHLLQTG